MSQLRGVAPLVAAGLGVPLDGVALPLGNLRVSVELVDGSPVPDWAVPTLERGFAGLSTPRWGVQLRSPGAAGLGDTTARTAALVAAIDRARAALDVEPLDGALAVDLVRRAARREVGHPLTAAACAALSSRAVCACGQEPYTAVNATVSPDLHLAVIVPAVAPDADAVRAILTAPITHQKSLELGARAATAVAALAVGDVAGLARALSDHGLLRPFERFVPGLYPVHQGALEAGAALFVCGRGPAVCLIAATAVQRTHAVAAVQHAWRGHAVASEVLDEWTT